MSTPYLGYQLQNGYIHNWLVAGPQAIPISDLERFQGEDFKLQIARQYYTPESGISQLPVERATLTIDDEKLTWNYYRCEDDHFVDLSGFYRTCHYLRSWAYAQILSPAAQEATLILTTNGPADVWLNGQHVHRQEHFHHQIPHSVSFQATLEEGRNEFIIRFEEVAIRECPYVMALQIVGLPEDEDVPVLLPTYIEAVARRQTLERIFQAAYLDRDVYGWGDEVTVGWPEDLVESASIAIRFQEPTGPIYAEAWPFAQASAQVPLLKGFQVDNGPYRAVLMPRPQEYYEGDMRVKREIPFWVLKNPYSETPEGTFGERRLEALENAAKQEGNLYAEIAKMELGRWDDVQKEPIKQAIEMINRREDCSDFYMVGLLGMMYRYMRHSSFPEELKPLLEECVLNFKYWMDEPGEDAMCYWSENHQILFHTCEILAGQLYPDRIFTNAEQSGQWHREKGERMALSWLRKRGTGGFREWDSNCYFEEDVLALAYLVDLAENARVRKMATMVLDKLLFTMAVNSFRGAFGSTHGRTYAPMIKGARLEATSGIARLMWGMGVFNQHIRGVVSLACAKRYSLSAAIRGIAADLPEEMWSRERHAGELEEWCDRATGSWEVNKVTYKTPDYMLSSAQDYHPGEPGVQQHIWQATLGPDAVVFVTHPPCVSEEGAHRPNFWHGNVVLPRVAQWKDVLIAIHKLPDNDWMGFTHAYFPLYAFDEHVIRDGWAFARKGDGYIALTAAQELKPMTRGTNAFRELRSYGQHNVWLCHLGRAAQDGSFNEFQDKILKLDIQFEGLSVRCPTLRGDTLQFAWEGPFSVNGKEQPLSGFKHYENPYCTADWPADQMDIRFRSYSLTLDFSGE